MFKEFAPRAEATSDAEVGGRLASYMNIVMGAWLLFSAFGWTHLRWEQLNTAVVGGTVLVCSLGALIFPVLRWVTVLASAWLIVSSFFVPHFTVGTPVNDIVVGLNALVCGLVPGARRHSRHFRQLTPLS